jgi:hypothetical protein
MIQRIHTIYLFLLTLINLVLSLIEFKKNSFINLKFLNFNFNDFYFFEIVTLGFFINILLYKNLSIQLNFLRILSLLTLILFFSSIAQFGGKYNSLIVYEILYFFISFLFIYFSLKSIKKDQKIISGTNRIR